MVQLQGFLGSPLTRYQHLHAFVRLIFTPHRDNSIHVKWQVTHEEARGACLPEKRGPELPLICWNCWGCR